jgi:hypothetical protein
VFASDITEMKKGAENVLLPNEELLRSINAGTICLRSFHDSRNSRMVASFTDASMKYKDKLMTMH